MSCHLLCDFVQLGEGEAFALSPEQSVSLEEAVGGRYRRLKEKPDTRCMILDYAGGANAATAQENAASGSELMTCAQDLKDSVKRFKLA